MFNNKNTVKKTEAQLIQESFQKPVLIVFLHSESGTSELMMYVINQVKKAFNQQIIVEVFTDNETNFIAKTFVENLSPSLLIIKNGSVVENYVGLVSRKKLEAKLNEIFHRQKVI